MLNRIIIIGRLTRDPELRYTPQGTPVVSATVAVDRRTAKDAEKQTDFIDIVAWRHTAEFISRYLSKGRLVSVEGRLQIRAYTDRDGNNRKAAEVAVDNIAGLDKPKQDAAPTEAASHGGLDDADDPFADE